MDDRYYSADELAAMKIRGLPKTGRNIRARATREQWTYRDVPGRGGKTGMRREYRPPADVQRDIDIRVGATEGQVKRTAPLVANQEPLPYPRAVDAELLAVVIAGVDAALSEQGLALDPSKRAQLMVLVYEHYRATGERDAAVLGRFLKLVA